MGGVWKKRKEQVEEIDDIERRGFWGFIFLHNTKPSSFGGTQKLYWRGFWSVYMSSSNLTYVVIIFLKLKIY